MKHTDMTTQHQFTSLEAYQREFTNVTFWRSSIERVCQHQQLVGSLSDINIRTGLPGTNPVFIIDERFVIKFYEIRLFLSGSRSFQIERNLYSWLKLPDLLIPQLVASGTLDDWPYIITQAIPGSSFGEMRAQISQTDRHALATLLGQTLRYLHQIPISSHPILSQMRDEFIDFIQKQTKECVERHRRWNTLPEHLIQQIPSYLHEHERLVPVSLIHADVTCDHVLGVFDSEGGHWHATGLIDFADAWVGDPAYELVALHCSVFEFDTNLLNTFLQAYQLFNERLVERAMVAMLLFEFNAFEDVAQHRSAVLCTATTLQELAESIWTVENK
ncbi:unnamed protein product [Didymodactylos carnosus]|uniref:Aminoglycoside phosphotransferase domain-containing protein n=1 Tax=Didymodactylos carnosus TaxID=1234261 RepID=A0A8S2DJ98_9BILA|nr:unnamed protein product [Didymodactylos carnosus]CAF3696804.1 unnamed protein product [Didymodactylos carnosus]